MLQSSNTPLVPMDSTDPSVTNPPNENSTNENSTNGDTVDPPTPWLKYALIVLNVVLLGCLCLAFAPTRLSCRSVPAKISIGILLTASTPDHLYHMPKCQLRGMQSIII